MIIEGSDPVGPKTRGSGFGSGSATLVRGMDPDPSVIYKNSKKNLDFYYFVTLVDFLSLKNDVIVA